VTVAVSLADKIDSLFQFFLIDERPTGSKDPFALRRAALAVAALILSNGLRFRLRDLLEYCGDEEDRLNGPQAGAAWEAGFGVTRDELLAGFEKGSDFDSPDLVEGLAFGMLLKRADQGVPAFLIDRLKVQQREAGVRHDLIDAVFALGGEDDLVRLLARVHALQSFVTTEDGANLLAGYKRAANILKKEGYETPSPLVGEGRGPRASASGKGEGDSVRSPTPPHPSAPSALPPSPTRGEGICLPLGHRST